MWRKEVISASSSKDSPLARLVRAVLAMVPAVFWLIGCDGKHVVQAPPPPEVMVVEVKQQDVPIHEEWVGTLAGEVNATISAQVSGYLISRNYREGSVVKKDQVLFQIDPRPFEAALAKAKAQLEEAQARKGKTALDVQRYAPLAATGAISQQELDDAIQSDKEADGQVASAQAAVLEATLNLGFTTIRSPVDGVAGLEQAQIGNLVGPGSGTLTTVSQVDPMRAYFSVSQQLMTRMMERALAEGKQLRTGNGPEVEVILASGDKYPHKGQVRFANNQVDIKTGTVRVVGVFPNPQMLLLPGMFVRVRALMETEKNALLVPQRAVSETQGRYLIAVVEPDNKVSVRPVEAGVRVADEWVIKGDVKAGDRVVAEGIQKVRQGAIVNPVPYKAPTTAPSATRS